MLCNRHGVSLCQLHTALAMAISLPTYNYLLPYPEIHDTGHTAIEIRRDGLDRLFGDLPCSITLSCAVEVINSILQVFLEPQGIVQPCQSPAAACVGSSGDEGSPERLWTLHGGGSSDLCSAPSKPCILLDSYCHQRLDL